MTIQTWWLYLCAVSLLCITPGPNMLYVMSTSVRNGFGPSVAAMAGCLTGLLIVLITSAAGLAALLLAWPSLFEALRIIGVAYLFWLGIKAWRNAGHGHAELAAQDAPRTHSLMKLYRGGLATALANPKAILFAAAFLPQFVSASAPKAPQFAILIVTMAACDTLCYIAYATGGRSLARYLARPGMGRLFDRFTGALFVGFGVALLGARQ